MILCANGNVRFYRKYEFSVTKDEKKNVTKETETMNGYAKK